MSNPLTGYALSSYRLSKFEVKRKAEAMTIDKEMMKALELDAQKLRAMTGDDSHVVEYMDEPCDVCGVWPCAHTDPDDWHFGRHGLPVLK
jgi:hypothetical protein